MQNKRREERVHALWERENGRDEPVRVQIDYQRGRVVDDIGEVFSGRWEVFEGEEHIESAREERRRRG